MSLALLLLGLPLLSYAADNGMDMSMDDGMTLATGTVMTTLHFRVATHCGSLAPWRALASAYSSSRSSAAGLPPLDSFKAFYVNKYADRHAHEIAF
ncbi:hypothetical protein DFH09DRAFT_1309947 [Mycena vulgaris]|nr:hypothetical protein DFH09DRAFT_1309947 [Mycena vulgaris]